MIQHAQLVNNWFVHSLFIIRWCNALGRWWAIKTNLLIIAVDVSERFRGRPFSIFNIMLSYKTKVKICTSKITPPPWSPYCQPVQLIVMQTQARISISYDD